MRIKGRTLTVVKTDTRRPSSSVESAHSATAGRSASPSVPSSLKPVQVIEIVNPIIAENYADTIRQLFTGSYLYNPAFADDAKGWTISEEDTKAGKIKMVTVDNKIRIKLGQGGLISQQNELIRKPPYHLIFEERPTEEIQQAMSTSVDTQWEELEEVTIYDKTRTEADEIHLKITFNCISNGILKIGFPESSQEETWMLEYIEREITQLGIQTIEASGVWDETGDFVIQFDEGEIEIVELSLTGNPLEEYQKQVNSAVAQIYGNLYTLLGGQSSLRDRIYIIQEEIISLQNKDIQTETRLDAIGKELESIKSTLENQARDVANAVNLATEAKHTADYFSYEVSNLSSQLSGLDQRISALEQS